MTRSNGDTSVEAKSFACDRRRSVVAIPYKVIAGIVYLGVMLAIATFAMTRVPTRERRIKVL